MGELCDWSEKNRFMSFWKNKRVLVTGGYGFLGKHLVRLLREVGCSPFTPKSDIYDLRYPEYTRSMLYDARHSLSLNALRNIDIVFHLAANVGGIGYNQKNPYDLFYENAIMGINLIHMAIETGVKKFVQVGTTCSYPKYCPTPFIAANFWNGYPEETNAAYGLAKKMLLVQLQAAREQYDFNGVYPVLTNLYGPGDNFTPEKSHVIPALIKRFVDAKDRNLPEVEIWGTGDATRDFLYVEDAAKALMLVAEKYNDPEPFNIGIGKYLRVARLVELLKELTEYEGKIYWNASKPDGQLRRLLSSDEANYVLEWNPEIFIREGLMKTIKWYKEQNVRMD